MDDLRGLVVQKLEAVATENHPNLAGVWEDAEEGEKAELVDEVIRLIVDEQMADIDAAISALESQFDGDDADWEVYEED